MVPYLQHPQELASSPWNLSIHLSFPPILAWMTIEDHTHTHTSLPDRGTGSFAEQAQEGFPLTVWETKQASQRHALLYMVDLSAAGTCERDKILSYEVLLLMVGV